MTTDPFTEAARAEAERHYPDHAIDSAHESGAEGVEIGARWARAHLAAQEPTDAELDALHDTFVAHSGPGREINEFSESCCTECGYAFGWPGISASEEGRRYREHVARAALSAARAARRDEEKRNG